MSSIEYRYLLNREISGGIDWSSDGTLLLSVCEAERLIAEGSVSNIVNAPSLFSELEQRNNLGIDNLDTLKELLRGIEKWHLIHAVEKFKVKRENYKALLEKVLRQLEELNDLNRLISVCGSHLAPDSVSRIDGVRALFNELESRNQLGPSCLGILKTILKETGKEDLLNEVNNFERLRKDEDAREARAAAFYAVPRVVGRIMGAVNVHCNFKTVGGVVVAVGAGVVLYKYSRGDNDIQQFANLFNGAILPAATSLCAIGNGSLRFTVQAKNGSALPLLWKKYQDNTLQKKLQEFLVTEEVRELADGEDVIVTVYISEHEFQDACLDFMMKDQGLSDEKDDRRRERNRRNSDSVVYVRPVENAVPALLTLKHAEMKFLQEKIKLLEIENNKLSEASAGQVMRMLLDRKGESVGRNLEDPPRGRKSVDRDTDSSYGSECGFEYFQDNDDVDPSSEQPQKTIFNVQTEELRADAGREVHLKFATTDVEEKPNYDEDSVIVKIEDPSGNLVKQTIEDNWDGSYTVSFIPDTVGPHSVRITVNGQPLTGSPWSVLVSPHKYKRLLKFGTRGKRQGQFKDPLDIAINEKTDHIAVADKSNYRVQMFSADGSYLREFCHKETASDPRSVAFTMDGNLVVVYSDKMYLFHESGMSIKHISKHLIDPWNVFVRSDGHMIVCDWGDKKIKVLSPDGTELLQSFKAPKCDAYPGFAVYHQDMFFVSYEVAHCIKVFNQKGKFLYDIGNRGSGDGQFLFPAGLAIDKFNNLMVCDSCNGRLQVFTLDGKLQSVIGGQGTNLMNFPYSVAVSNAGQVFVIDMNANCVHIFQ